MVEFIGSGGAAPYALLAGLSTVSGGFSGAPDRGGQQVISASFAADSTNTLTAPRGSIPTSRRSHLVAQAKLPGGNRSPYSGFIGARQAT